MWLPTVAVGWYNTPRPITHNGGVTNIHGISGPHTLQMMKMIIPRVNEAIALSAAYFFVDIHCSTANRMGSNAGK